MHYDGVVEFARDLFAWNGITFCKSVSVSQQLILFKLSTPKTSYNFIFLTGTQKQLHPLQILND